MQISRNQRSLMGRVCNQGAAGLAIGTDILYLFCRWKTKTAAHRFGELCKRKVCECYKTTWFRKVRNNAIKLRRASQGEENSVPASVVCVSFISSKCVKVFHHYNATFCNGLIELFFLQKKK